MEKTYELLLQEAAEHLQIVQNRLETAKSKATTGKQRTHLIEILGYVETSTLNLGMLRILSRNPYH
jgi:hypothetical protein